MKKLLPLILGSFFLFFSASAFPEELKICEEGIGKCKPLIANAEKFSKCMRLMCFNYYSDKEKQEKDDSKYYFKYVGIEDNTAKKPDQEVSEQAKTCDYGLRKCDILKNIPEYYWECVTDSCNNPTDAKPDCELGQNMCTDRQKMYNDCMRLTCGNPSADFDSCPAAKFTCNESLRSYWQCVYGVCLGSVDQYKRPPSSKKYMIILDANGKKKKIQVNKTEPVMGGFPGFAAKAPPGVDPEEWIRGVPQKFLINGNPSEYMQCILPSALLDCPQNDMRSCRCNDGTVPIMMNGMPTPGITD